MVNRIRTLLITTHEPPSRTQTPSPKSLPMNFQEAPEPQEPKVVVRVRPSSAGLGAGQEDMG